MVEPNDELDPFNKSGDLEADNGSGYNALEDTPETNLTPALLESNNEDDEEMNDAHPSLKPLLTHKPIMKKKKSLKGAALAVLSSRKLMKLGKNVRPKQQFRTSMYLNFGGKEESRKNSVELLFPEVPVVDPPSTAEWLLEAVFQQNVSFLLIFLPFAALSHYKEWNPILVFWFNFLAMVPLATILGDFTEELALHTNQTIGGLINATFGNAVEVVVAIQALLANEIRVVQASMLGSIFSNLLLVLGSCFLFGGIFYKEQSFNSTAATANTSLLALAGTALVLPTPFAENHELGDEEVLVVSRFAACFLLLMYILLLFFQLKTHAGLFEDDDQANANIPFFVAILGLITATAIITVLSDWLVASIDGFVEETGLSKTFVGIILLPIVGNAVEHLTAVSMAMKDKMDLAMAIAIGSCVQIALFVIPVIVLVGWAVDRDMTLHFPTFEIILFIMSVLIVSISMGNTSSNWLLGALLVTTYIMVGVGFWFENVPSDSDPDDGVR